jgi:hypothetical protein
MIRGDNLICGTTTTGTGTLTLAATPVPPGGVDFDVFVRTTGIGFGNSAIVFVSYTIIEYTDSTFATAKGTEKGIGTLTLGSSAGIANATLARTTLQTTATSLNSQPATQNITPATALSIGTTANTLVFIGVSAADVPAYSPYFESALDTANAGVPIAGIISGTDGAAPNMADLTDQYFIFEWCVPMLVKRAEFYVANIYTGGTSNLYARIYQINSAGRPGKLLYDFGVVGTPNSSLAAAAIVQTGAGGSGFFLTPGAYFIDLLPHFTGGSGTPAMQGNTRAFISGQLGTNATLFGTPFALSMTSATGGTTGAASDPANVAGYARAGGGNVPYASFSPT